MKCEPCCGCCVSPSPCIIACARLLVLSFHSLACLLAPISVQFASASFLFLFILRITFISSLDARCAYLFFDWLLFYLLRFFSVLMRSEDKWVRDSPSRLRKCECIFALCMENVLAKHHMISIHLFWWGCDAVVVVDGVTEYEQRTLIARTSQTAFVLAVCLTHSSLENSQTNEQSTYHFIFRAAVCVCIPSTTEAVAFVFFALWFRFFCLVTAESEYAVIISVCGVDGASSFSLTSISFLAPHRITTIS